MRAGAAVAALTPRELYDLVAATGGATVDPTTLAPIDARAGYVVGLTDGTALTIDAGADAYSLAGSLRLVASVYRAAAVGAWVEGGRTHVDPVEVVADLADALARAVERKQVAVYDLARGEAIDVATATGGRS